MDYGADGDGYLPGQGAPSSREEKVSSLKTVRASSMVVLLHLCASVTVVNIFSALLLGFGSCCEENA